MSIWNKILVGLVILAAGAFGYMAARTLKTHQAWRTSAQKYERALKAVLKENIALETGSESADGPKGIVQLKAELHGLLCDRGRVWAKCEPKSVAAEGAVKLGILLPEGEKPSPHGIHDKMRLLVFEGIGVKEGGHFLGEFKAAEIGEREIGLLPTRKLTPAELERLTQAQAKARQTGIGWMAYEEMPTDGHDVFAGKTAEELRTMLPESVVAEYVRDGKPAEAGDAEARRDANGNYVRPLRDYSLLLEVYSRARTELIDLIECGKIDSKAVEDSLADARRQEEFCRKEIDELKQQVAEFKRHRDAVAAHRKEVEDRLAEVKDMVVQQIATNQQMAAEIARYQLEATRLIDSRTGAMARLGANQ